MKLPSLNPHHLRGKRRRQAAQSGAVLAEACIGLSMLVLVWILGTYSCYMADNRVRTAMAARHVAWLKGNGGNPTDAALKTFFSDNDVKFAHVSNPVQSVPLFSLGGGSYGQDGNSFSTWKATVTFGKTDGEVTGTKDFPFNLLNVNIPFVNTATYLTNFTTVSSFAAWPEGQTDTWDSVSKLLGAFGLSFP